MSLEGVLGAACVVAVAIAVWLRAEHPVGVVDAVSGLARLRRRSERREVGAGLPILLDELARSLRAGLSLRTGLTGAIHLGPGALRRDMDQMVTRLDRGAPLSDALEVWADERHDVAGVRLAVAAITLAAQSGGQMAQALDGVADTLRSEVALASEVRSLAAQAEASAGLIAVLPLVFGLVAGAADPQMLRFLIGTSLGAACLVVGVMLDIVGFAWMRRITSRIA